MKIAVYGANGYQAKLVLAGLTRRGIDPVLVGRNVARVRETATTLGIADAAQRTADADDHDALVTAFAGCDAVVNCAGPFTSLGHTVVRAAVTAGCHYVDTAGEQLYVKSVFDTVADAAERAGVTVVPAANDGCVPGDLVARLVAERIGTIDAIVVSHFIIGGGGLSRGSLRSIVETVEMLASGGLTYHDGDWRDGTAVRCEAVTLPGASHPTPVVKFPLSEVVTIPRHVSVRHVEGVVDAALGDRLCMPLSPQVIDGLPDGPTEDSRRTQRFTYLVDAVGVDGRRARGVVQGTDTYGTTAVVAVEAARRLVAGGVPPGVLAPAQAYDPTEFLHYLVRHGVSWSVDLDESV